MPSDGRVLVVDPDADEVATPLDQSLSVTTTTAGDPERAVSVLADHPVDCVVTELRFDTDANDDPHPSRNGPPAGAALLDRLRERDPTLPVVVYTDADLDGADPATLVGASACVRKGSGDAEQTLAEWVDRCVAAGTGRRDRLGGVVHDLRNPLRAANLSLARLRRDADLDDEQVAALAATHERLGELLEDLDALVDAGRPVADIESVALDAVAREAWRTVDTHGATLRVETGATVDADRRTLRRLVENCFANAVEHGSTNPDSQARQDAGEQSSTSPRSSSTREDAGSASASEPSVADAPEDAVEQSSTSPRSSSTHEDAGSASASEPSVADAPEDAVEHGSTSEGSTTERDPTTDDAAVADSATDVTVTVGDCGEGFFVADDGTGIPERDREVVFERGYSTVDGTGYGLAIVAELAAAHGWSVSATESASGGARIEVRT